MAAASDYKSSEKAINREYTDFMYGLYMKNYWLVQVGYKADPVSVVQKTLLDWQLQSDCDNSLCVKAKTEGIYPDTYMSLTNFNRDSIYRPLCAHAKGSQYNCNQGDCNIYYGNCGCGYTYSACCANAPYNLVYNLPLIWNQ